MMRTRYAFAAAAAVITMCTAGRSTQAQVECARPNVPATTLRAVLPQTPPLAMQQGIGGVVQVIVSLDQQSRVVGTRIQSSPSAILNQAALAAARQSTFQTEVRDCKPIAADFIFSVEFDAQNGGPRITTNAGGTPTVVITGQGVASRAADVAFVDAIVVTSDDDAAAAGAKNAAMIAAIATKLRALGIDPEKSRTSFAYGAPYSSYTPSPGVRASSGRALSIRVDNLRDVAKVVDAVTSTGPGAVVRDVQYGLADRGRAYDEALANAIKDARARAERVAAGEHLHVASVDRIVVGQREQSSVTLSRAVAAGAPPGPVEVRVEAVVTFLLKP